MSGWRRDWLVRAPVVAGSSTAHPFGGGCGTGLVGLGSGVDGTLLGPEGTAVGCWLRVHGPAGPHIYRVGGGFGFRWLRGVVWCCCVGLVSVV